MTARESVERRYLGGLVLEDATTGAPVREALEVTSTAARFFRNASGVYVVRSAQGLESHLDEFESPPDEPDPGSVPIEIFIADKTRTYLPRLFTLRVPRSADPSSDEAVTEPVRVPMYRSLAAPVGGNWAVIVGTLVDDDGAPINNAIVQVLRQSDDALLGEGLLVAGAASGSDQTPRMAGELWLPLARVPLVMWSDQPDGSVRVSNVAVRLEIIPVPAALTPFDPDQFRGAASTSRGPFTIASGRRENVGILQVSVPV